MNFGRWPVSNDRRLLLMKGWISAAEVMVAGSLAAGKGMRAPMIPGTPTLSHGSPAANAAMPEPALPTMHATTILMVRKGQRVVIGGDGQVSLGQTIVKGNAKKVRRLAKGVGDRRLCRRDRRRLHPVRAP